MDTMTIGKLADDTGVGIETIRYYEKRQLISPLRRTASGYRIFDGASAQRIRFIKNAQYLGFTLDEIGELFKLKVKKGGRCGSVKMKAEKKIGEIEEKIEALSAMKESLTELLTDCKKNRPTGNCPILKSLERNNIIGDD